MRESRRFYTQFGTAAKAVLLRKRCKTPTPEFRTRAHCVNIAPMKQTTLNLDRSLKREFLEQMEHVVRWAALVKLIAPHYPKGSNGRPPFSRETMLRIHFMQQWFSLSDPGMEEDFFDVPLSRVVPNSNNSAACPTSAPSRVSAIGSNSTSWPNRSSPPSISC